MQDPAKSEKLQPIPFGLIGFHLPLLLLVGDLMNVVIAPPITQLLGNEFVQYVAKYTFQS